MEIQFITEAQGRRTEKAQDVLEHVYLASLIEECPIGEQTCGKRRDYS